MPADNEIERLAIKHKLYKFVPGDDGFGGENVPLPAAIAFGREAMRIGTKDGVEAARTLAVKILSNCAAHFMQPNFYNSDDPQSVIDLSIRNATLYITESTLTTRIAELEKGLRAMRECNLERENAVCMVCAAEASRLLEGRQ